MTEPGTPATTPEELAVPQLELDQLLAQLIERAEDVRSAHDRLRELIRANNMLIGDLTLPVVLRRIVTAAVELVHARYGALGVIAPGGGLEEFVHVGIEDGVVREIGHLPEGKGLLGALIEDPRPIRLHRITDDPRSTGFPPGHPPMDNFLGVPIRIRNEVFGNLYLTSREDGQDFTEQDQELVSSLAANAAFAIENARLYGAARRRQDWLAASTDITQQLLSAQGEEPLRMIARRTLQMADADSVLVVLPVADTDRFIVEVATGVGADKLTAMSYPQEGTLSAHVLIHGLPALVEDFEGAQSLAVHASEVLELGALMALPLVGAAGTRGVLLVSRLRGRPRFDAADLDMATTFANHAAIALELADARADQQRVLLLEDRDRIARDLHDHVIQRLFAAGLSVESVAARLSGSGEADRLARVVGDIDDTIRQIRSSIFQLRGNLASAVSGLRTKLLKLTDEMVESLGFRPQLSFTGPVDIVADDALIENSEAVLREALSNVSRHAGASQVEISVAALDNELTIEVTDDGVGMSATERRSGLENLRRRAEQLGGSFEVTSPWQVPEHSEGGTRLQWKIPLS